jgi:hypothetical protein
MIPADAVVIAFGFGRKSRARGSKRTGIAVPCRWARACAKDPSRAFPDHDIRKSTPAVTWCAAAISS